MRTKYTMAYIMSFRQTKRRIYQCFMLFDETTVILCGRRNISDLYASEDDGDGPDDGDIFSAPFN